MKKGKCCACVHTIMHLVHSMHTQCPRLGLLFVVPFLSFFVALQRNQQSQNFCYATSPGCPLRCPPFIFSPLSSRAGAGRIKMDNLGYAHAGFYQKR